MDMYLLKTSLSFQNKCKLFSLDSPQRTTHIAKEHVQYIREYAKQQVPS